jgi:hypothetical protein
LAAIRALTLAPCWTCQPLAKARQQGAREPRRNLALLALAPGVLRLGRSGDVLLREERGFVMNKALMGG